MSDNLDLAHLRDLSDKATSAPWRVVNWVDHATSGEPRIVGNYGTAFVAEAYRMNDPNAVLIAAMRNAFPALLDVCRRSPGSSTRCGHWQAVGKLKPTRQRPRPGESAATVSARTRPTTGAVLTTSAPSPTLKRRSDHRMVAREAASESDPGTHIVALAAVWPWRSN